MKSKVMLSVLMLTCMALNVNLAWGAETLVETVGFESSEGYTSSTTYNSSDYTTGTSGSKWTINYGAFATSGAIVGSQSAQFRVYSAGNYGQLRNTVAYESDITKVVFNTKVSNKNSSIKVSCSADGISWTDIETISFSGTTMVEHTSTISASGARYIQFTAAGSKPSSSNYQIYIDAVKIYTTGGVTYTDYLTECESCDPVGEELIVTAAATTLTIGSDDKASTTLSTSGGNKGTITFSVTPDDKANISGNSITFTAAGTYTVTASQDKTDGKCSQRATVDITVNPRQYTLTFVDRGNTHDTQQHIAGEKATKPADPTGVCTEPTEYIFDGWAERTVNAESKYTKVDFDTYTMPAKDTQLYAVYRYAEGEQTIFTAGSSGDFLIYAKEGEILHYAIGGVSDNQISTTTDVTKASTYTVTSLGNDIYTIQYGSSYIGKTDGNNVNLTANATVATWNQWKITSSSNGKGTWRVTSVLKDNRGLIYSSNYLKAYATSNVTTTGDYYDLEIGGSNTLYTTSPKCGPYVRVTAGKDVYVTAGNAGGTRSCVQVQDTVRFVAGSLKGSNGKKPGVEIPAADIKIGDEATTKLTCDITQEVTDNGDGTYSISGYIVLKYNPTDFDKTEDIQVQLRAEYNTTDVSLDNFTVHARALPQKFVIAAKHTDGNWYALNGDMSGSKTQFANAHLTVDDTDAPTQATRAACNTLYTFDGMPDGDLRYVRFIGTTQQYLWAATGDNTGIKNYAKNQPTALDSAYNWLLQTSDNKTYRFANKNNKRTLALDNQKGIRYGMYMDGNGTHDIRILPVVDTCVYNYAPTKINVIARSTTATLTWDAVAGADKYQYRDSTKAEWTDGTSSPTITLSGLTKNTKYTYFVRAVHGTSSNICSDEASVTFTTTDCDDVPYDISYTSDVNSITLSWTMTAGKAIVRVYSDDAGTRQEGSDYTNATSPYTITGLTKATTYYVKILAGGSCPSELVEVSTERPQLDVVEWKPNGIDVAINTNEKISVILENQVTKGSGTGLIADELFFSKYFEATGNVKLVAVYNGTGHDVDVTNYTIKYGKTGWESGYIKLGNFTKAQNTMAAGEEVILYSVGNNAAQDKSIMNCVSAAYPDAPWQLVTPSNSGGSGWLQFAGDKTIALYDGNTLLDVIGAITPEGVPTNTGASMKKPSWGDDPGWTCDTGLSIEDGTEIGISTNRCLLVRKNTVKSGAKAVAQNTADFATLCDEWLGQHVPDDAADNGVQASCDNFAYVGTFDYSGYYTTYDVLKETVFDNSKRNDDGTFTIEIPRMDTLACKGLKIIAANEGGNVLTTKDYKVPILVTSDATTADRIFSHFGGDTCKTCDVVVRDKATLTKAEEGTPNDKPQVRDVKIYEGASLVVPSGTNYTVNSLSLRRKEDAVSTVDVAGTLTFSNTSGKPVYLDLRINAENWHWFTLPYNCAIADVTWSNGQPAEFRKDWFLMYYDGARRATGVDSGNWKEYSGDTIHAGQGFIVGIKGDGNDKHAYELRFPMAKEVITDDGKDKKVEVYAYGAGTEVRPNHKGWNLVGNPYLNYYKKDKINSFGGLRLSKLIYDPVTGWYSLGTDNNPYVVIPQNFGWSAYKQVLVSSQDLLPFTSYFIQVGKDDGSYTNGQRCEVQFTSGNRGKSAKAALMTSAAEEAEEEPVITGIVLRNAKGEEDETSLVIAERFGSSYEMGADFFKWFGDYYKYYTLPVLYSIGDDGGKRAFNAVNEEGAKQSIPLGMYAARDGQYTFSLNTRSDLSRVDKVWLYDAESGRYTDLLREDYTFATTRTEGSGRFFLSVVLKEKEITTSADNARYGDLSLYADKQTLVVRGLPVEAEVWVYDPSGKLLHHEQTRHYERQYEVPQQGTYLVRVESKDGGVTLRGVCR